MNSRAGHLKKLHTFEEFSRSCRFWVVVVGSVISCLGHTSFSMCVREDVLLINYNNKFEEKILSCRIAPRSGVCASVLLPEEQSAEEEKKWKK